MVVKALLMYAARGLDVAHNLVLPCAGPPVWACQAAAQGATYVHAMLHRQGGRRAGNAGLGQRIVLGFADEYAPVMSQGAGGRRQIGKRVQKALHELHQAVMNVECCCDTPGRYLDMIAGP